MLGGPSLEEWEILGLNEKLEAHHKRNHELEREVEALRKENARLSEIISYLPKVPTEPYQREMAKEISRLRGALDLALYYVNGDATYEVLVEKIKTKYGIDVKALASAGGEGVKE